MLLKDTSREVEPLFPIGYDIPKADLIQDCHQDTDICILGRLSTFLGYFERLTEIMSSASYVTASSMIGLFNLAIDCSEDVISTCGNMPEQSVARKTMVSVANRARNKMIQYYNKTGKIEMTAAYFDPRIRLEYFLSNGFVEDDVRSLETQ